MLLLLGKRGLGKMVAKVRKQSAQSAGRWMPSYEAETRAVKMATFRLLESNIS